MNETVSDEMRRNTSCLHDFSCLATGMCGKQRKCEAVFEGGRNMLFLKPKNEEWIECKYREYWGSGWLCRCPVNFASYMHEKRKERI